MHDVTTRGHYPARTLTDFRFAVSHSKRLNGTRLAGPGLLSASSLVRWPDVLGGAPALLGPLGHILPCCRETR